MSGFNLSHSDGLNEEDFVLAEKLREAREQAWDEGWLAAMDFLADALGPVIDGHMFYDGTPIDPLKRNPYRKEKP